MDTLNLNEYQPVCAKDFSYFAEKNVRPDLYAYYKSGATNEFTLAENEKAFKRYLFYELKNTIIFSYLDIYSCRECYGMLVNEI